MAGGLVFALQRLHAVCMLLQLLLQLLLLLLQLLLLTDPRGRLRLKQKNNRRREFQECSRLKRNKR